MLGWMQIEGRAIPPAMEIRDIHVLNATQTPDFWYVLGHTECGARVNLLDYNAKCF